MLKKEAVVRANLMQVGQPLRARISAVEPFTGLNDNRYIKPFDKIERQPGSLFPIYPCGQPTLTVVEDPAQRSLIVIKKLLVHNRELVLGKLLTDPEHGNMDKDEMLEFVRSLDGVVPGPDAVIDFQDIAGALPTRVDLQRDDKTPENSLGRIVLVRG